MHDAFSAHDVLRDELAQRAESGYDVAEYQLQFGSGSGTDVGEAWELADALEHARRLPAWGYSEPQTVEDIVDALPLEPSSKGPTLRHDTVSTMILGGWAGRIAGCMLGKPVENGAHWTRSHLRCYLEGQVAYPLLDYVPKPDLVAGDFAFREFWPTTTRGRIHGSTRDDDIDYTVLALHTLSKYGPGYRAEDVCHEWLRFLPVLQTYTGERAALRNLIAGITPPRTATFRNPYREWIGARIRADMFGWTNPGRPRAAALASLPDASITSTGNGIYAAMWAAALTASSFVAEDAATALQMSLEHIPPRTRLAEAITRMIAWHAEGMSWDSAMDRFDEFYSEQNWFHSINNSAVVTAGLLWAGGDFSTALGLTVQAGLDTDSNGALAGSVAAILSRGQIPAHWTEPLADDVSTLIFGYDHASITSLAKRTAAIVQW